MKNEMIKRRFSVIIVSALIMLGLIIMTSCGRKDENVRIEKHVSKNDKVISSEYDDIIVSDSEIKPGGEDDKIQQVVTLKEVNDKVGKPEAVEEPLEESDESSEAEGMSVSEPTEEIEISANEVQCDSDAKPVATVTVVPSQHVATGGSTITPIPTEKQSVTMPVNPPAAAVKPDTPASDFIPTATSTMTPTVTATATPTFMPVPTKVPAKLVTPGITQTPTPKATISPTPKATSTPKPTAATKKNSPTPTVHVHNWVDVTKTVHHEAKGYWLEEWDEDIYITTSQCRVCKKTSYDLGYDVYNLNTGEFISTDYQGFGYHCGHCGPEETAGLRGYRSYQEKVNTIHHEPEFFIYSNAYDETVPGSRCSGCGEEVWAW